MIDSILLEVLWRRLLSIVNEQAAALIHSSFTTLVREAGGEYKVYKNSNHLTVAAGG